MELTTNIEGGKLSVTTVKDTVSHFNCIFMMTSFISALVEASKRMNSPKKKSLVWTTSKRVQHNVELFLRSELGHSPKRIVRLVGYEQRSVLHQNKTTPYPKACRFPFDSSL